MNKDKKEKEFVSYPIALKLKELGFDYDTIFFWFPDFNKKQQPQALAEYKDDQTFYLEYGKNYIGISKKNVETLYKEGLFQLTIPAPLWQQAFEWLREKYNYMYAIDDIEVSSGDTVGYRFKYIIWKLVTTGDDGFYIVDESILGFLTYEEAQLACLETIVNNLKK